MSPGAKLGSTAPYSLADLVAVEVGKAQPCTWANAFFDPIPVRPAMKEQAISAMKNHVQRLDKVYALGNSRHFVTVHEKGFEQEQATEAENLHTLGAWAAQCVREGVS